MTAIPMTATTSSILAIDFGKYKSVACVYDPAAAGARFETFSTSRTTLQRMLEHQRPAAVVIEACALPGWVSDR